VDFFCGGWNFSKSVSVTSRLLERWEYLPIKNICSNFLQAEINFCVFFLHITVVFLPTLEYDIKNTQKLISDCRKLEQIFFIGKYSHLSNKRELTLTDFEKFHPPQKKSTLHVYWFLRFFPPSTPRLLELCTSFLQKIPPSTFSDLATFAPPPRLLERWEYVSLITFFWQASQVLVPLPRQQTY
jgi:hypothetical protein